MTVVCSCVNKDERMGAREQAHAPFQCASDTVEHIWLKHYSASGEPVRTRIKQ